MIGHQLPNGTFAPATRTDPTDVPPCTPGFERIAEAADESMWDCLKRDIYVSPAMQAMIDNAEAMAS